MRKQPLKCEIICKYESQYEWASWYISKQLESNTCTIRNTLEPKKINFDWLTISYNTEYHFQRSSSFSAEVKSEAGTIQFMYANVIKCESDNSLQNIRVFFTQRCIQTMPRGRMQHIAALLRSKSCSAYAANLMTSTLKKNFLQRLQKLWNEPANSVWFFSLTSWCNFETLYSSYTTQQTFDETDILPIKFLCRMAYCNIQKPCLNRAALTSTLFPPFAAWQGRILLHSTTRHSVNASLYNHHQYRLL